MTLDIKFYLTDVKDADRVLVKIREVLGDYQFEWNFGGNNFDYGEMEQKSKLPEILNVDPKEVVKQIMAETKPTEAKK